MTSLLAKVPVGTMANSTLLEFVHSILKLHVSPSDTELQESLKGLSMVNRKLLYKELKSKVVKLRVY